MKKYIVYTVLLSFLMNPFYFFGMKSSIEDIAKEKKFNFLPDDLIKYDIISFLREKELGNFRLTCQKYKNFVDKDRECLNIDSYENWIFKKISCCFSNNRFGSPLIKHKEIKKLVMRLEKKLENRKFVNLIMKCKKSRINSETLKPELFSLFNNKLENIIERLKDLDIFREPILIFFALILVHFFVSRFFNINPVFLLIYLGLSVYRFAKKISFYFKLQSERSMRLRNNIYGLAALKEKKNSQ